MIGLAESANEMDGVTKGTVFGGSYLGLDKVDDNNAFTLYHPPNSLFNLYLEGPADTTSPAIGLRCVRYSD